MPELPDVTVYVERLNALLAGATLRRVRLRSPFLLRTVEPPLAAVEGRTIAGVRRMGKRLVFELRGGKAARLAARAVHPERMSRSSSSCTS